ncbi:MAG TPA: AsmA-like C-terminal region-containing protein [Asticcacaulis sp.]|nr:AsmA-like C-terminal region-containing protein [Asticcacaulis sp.]
MGKKRKKSRPIPDTAPSTRAPAKGLASVKRLFEALAGRLRLFVLAWVVVMVGLLSWRLASGPIRVDLIKPIIINRLESQLPHTHASLKHLDLVWFNDAKAVGFRFDDLIILDNKNRIIARAGKLETALAADSLLLAHFAPARLTAEDFFVAASVSREGKYDLGFEAHGSPEAVGELGPMLIDLTGREQLGRPVSFTRQIVLKNGEFRLIQEGAPLDWTAKVATIDFSKLHGKLKAHLDLTIDSLGGRASLQAAAEGKVGLKSAAITADIRNLIPSRVFPSAGVTHHLAAVDAPVNGRARVEYSAKKGFEGAYVDLAAGSGHVDLGHTRQDFDGANIVATYASATRTVVFQKFRLKAHLLDTDLHGWVQISPEDVKKKKDLDILFDFAGPRATGRLADDFAAQTLTSAHFKGNFTPRLRRLRIDTGTGNLNGAPFESQGIVYTDDQGRLGADLTAKIKGRFTKDEVFAFWPEDLSPITRSDLIERIKGGDFSNANFVLKAKPGELSDLSNDNLRLDFDFQNVQLGIEHRMHDAEGMQGHGILLGDSFTMDVSTGRLVDVVLSHGALSVPSFHDHDSKTHIWLESETPAVNVIEAVDPLADNQLGPHGLNRERMSGLAKVRVDIEFPTFHDINSHTFGLTFDAHIADAGLKQAALGWDLSGGELNVHGDLLADKLEVKGPAKLGPYTGDISYTTQFVPKAQHVDFKGSFNAAQFGGNPHVPVPIKGSFVLNGGKGQGTVEADIFRGNVSWTNEGSDDPDRPSQVIIDGVTLASGMEAQGVPIFEHLKPELPTKISLLRSGEIWGGEIDAEALTGDIAYVQGKTPRLVYRSTITPDEARELGYGALPVFHQDRHLTVNIALDADSKEALIKLDQMNAVLGWSEQPGTDELLRRLKMTVQPDDWETLGLPKSYFLPKAPVEVTALWRQIPGRLEGTVKIAGQDIDFTMPTRDRGVAAEADMPYSLQVRGTLTDQLRDIIGYRQDPVRIKGPLAMVFSLYDTPGMPAAVLNVDAAQAELGVRATDWTKPAGEAATLVISFDDQGNDSQGQPIKGVNLSRILGQGARVQIDGRASFDGDGNLQFADFSNVYLKDFIDATFKYYVLPGQETNVMAISGSQLDLRPWLQGEAPDQAHLIMATAQAAPTKPEPQTPTHMVVNLDRLQTSAEGAFTGLKLDINWDGKNGLDGQGTARTLDGSPIALALRSEKTYSLFSLRTDNFGNAVRTLSGVTNLRGGEGTIEGAYQDGQIDADIRGENIRLLRIPVLAQLLTVASMTGLNDTLTGEGIAFTDFDFPVRYRDNVVFVRNGWAKGKALGINVWGTTDFKRQGLALNGTLIPAYRVNALFGDVRSNGLGLVGLHYDVNGAFKTPQVGVNPLSVIMPGFIKVAAQSGRKDAIKALDLPSIKDKLAQLRNETRLPSGN